MNWWQRLWHPAQLEQQLDSELRFHLEAHVNELIASGVAPGEALRQARLALGGPEQVKEKCRDERGTRWIDDLRRDLRLTLRTLAQNPGFAVVVLLTLGLGTGATTVMFSVINGVLLKPLPYPEPDRLVVMHGRADSWNSTAYGEQNIAYLDFQDAQRAVHSLELAGVVEDGATLTAPGEPEYLDNVFEITAPLFDVLRVPVALGRAFLPSEDRQGGAPVAILGYSLWQRHFGGRASVLGTQLSINGRTRTIVGVAAARFRDEDAEPDILVPLGQNPSQFLQNRAGTAVHVRARLRPGATMSQAAAELAVLGPQLARQYPGTNQGRSFVVEPLRPDVGEVRLTLWLLLGAVGLVLLIACTNVASLLLARATAREREMSMRVALGAGRSRLVRQCLTESMMLGLLGGLLGVALAAGAIRPFVAWWPGSLPRAEEVGLDWRVFGAALAVALGSGMLFGLAPALRYPGRHLERSLRSVARGVVGTPRRLHRTFVVSELALAFILLVAAATLGRTLLRVSALDPGVDIQNVLISRVALSPAALADPTRGRVAWRDILNRARRIPGVQAVALADTVPLREGSNRLGYWTGPEQPKKSDLPLALATSVSPGYLSVMRIPLRHGRFFDDHDRLGSAPVIVIDDVLAARAFPHQEAIGKRLWIPDMPCVTATIGNAFADCTVPYTIVGVVGHVRYWGLANDDQATVRSQIYYAFAQVPDPFIHRWSQLTSIAIRTTQEPLSVVHSLRQDLRGAAGDQVLYDIHTLDELAHSSLAFHRFLGLLFALFSGLALVLACIGIYGVLTYSVSRRVPEIGVRMALGATGQDVLRLISRESLSMIAVGVALGLCGALAVARVLSRLVAAVHPAEPLAFAWMTVLLVAAAMIASFVPARRASRLDPVTALRRE